MKASTIRNVTWGAAVLVFAAGGWQLWNFLKERDQRLFAADKPAIDSALRAPKKQDQALRKPLEFYEPIRRVNVRGIEPPKPIPKGSEIDSKPAVNFNPLDLVVELKGTQYFAPDSKFSAAFVTWKDAQISEKDKKNRILIGEGEAFPPPYDKKYRMARIEMGKAFVVNDEGKEFPLTVKELTSSVKSSKVAGPESRSLVGEPESRPVEYKAPEETEKKSETEYWISKKDSDEIADKGLDLIGREVHTAPYLDPKTKRPVGLRVTLIRPNSVASRFGLKEGDIVRELNGSSIKSTSDIYTFSQDNPSVKTVQLTVERYGRLVTLTYVLP